MASKAPKVSETVAWTGEEIEGQKSRILVERLFDQPGLHVVAEPIDTVKADIIFVHGLSPNSQTWAGPGADLWPRELLPKRFPEVRIMLFSYDVDLIDFTQGFKLENVSRQLMSRLRHVRGDKTRPVIFVAHSLGGLVVKQVMIDSIKHLAEDDIAEHVIGVLFFGTPHSGSNFALWSNTLASISGVFRIKHNASVAMSLNPTLESLSILDAQFFPFIRRHEGQIPIELVSFYETLPVPGLGIVVPATSATLPGYRKIRIDSNHKNLTTFTGEDDIGYGILVQEIGRILARERRGSRDDSMHEGEPEITLDQIFRQGDPYSRAEALQRQIAETTRLSYGDMDERSLWERKRLADVYFARGLWFNAKEALDEIHEVYIANRSGYSNRLAWGLLNSLALLHLELGLLGPASKLAQRCLDLKPSVEDACVALDISAAVLFQLGHYEKCSILRTELAGKAREEFNKDFRTVQAEAITSMTSIFLEEVDNERVHLEQQRALDTFQLVFGDRHPISLRQVNILAFLQLRSLLKEVSSPTPQITTLGGTLNLAEKGAYGLREVLGPDHPYSLQASHNLAIALALSGLEGEAESISSSVTRSVRRTFSVDHHLASASRRLTSILKADNRLTELTKEVKELLLDWTGSAQWLPNLIFSGAAFEDPSEKQVETPAREAALKLGEQTTSVLLQQSKVDSETENLEA